MKHLKKIFIAAVLLIVCLPAISQNQLHLSQYMLHQPFLNPASIGSYEYINGALLYRKQWVGFEGAPSVQGFNFNIPFKRQKNFVGLNVFNDRIGVNKRTDVSATYAYRLGINENSSLSFGLSATLAMLQSNLADVELVDKTDQVFSSNTETFMAPDFKFGIYYFSKKFYAGFALPRLMDNEIIFEQGYQNQTKFDIQSLHYHLHAGYLFKLTERLDLNSSVLIKQVSGSPMQFDLNAQAVYNNIFGIGASYRSQKILVALVNFQITKFFKLGYAYDYNFTELSNVSSGSHEIMLIFNLVRETQAVKIDAPRF